MLVTFSVVYTSSIFVFNRKLTFGKDDLTLNEFLISRKVSVNAIVEIKVGSSMNSLCSVERSCINDILMSDQCIPGTCIFYNSWEKKTFSPHSRSNNQLSCSILRKIFTMWAGDYEQIINYDWPNSYGMLKWRWTILHKKSECRMFNLKYTIMACTTLRNLLVASNDSCEQQRRLQLKELKIVKSFHVE